MSQKAMLLLPMIGMIFLTFGVMFWMLKLRYKAVLEDGVDPRYFKLYGSDTKLPDYLVKVTQHSQNLMEMPFLFYAALVLIVVLNINDTFYVLLSWGFFATRLIHSYIHTTSNRLIRRKNVFIVSMVILFILWIRIAIDVIAI